MIIIRDNKCGGPYELANIYLRGIYYDTAICYFPRGSTINIIRESYNLDDNYIYTYKYWRYYDNTIIPDMRYI